MLKKQQLYVVKIITLFVIIKKWRFLQIFSKFYIYSTSIIFIDFE